jgi:TPR repeat protein
MKEHLMLVILNKSINKFAVILLLLCTYGCTSDSSYDKGLKAYAERNYTEALKYFSLSAKKNNLKSYEMLGYMHFKGEGVKQNYTEAFYWYRKAAEKGSADGCYSCGYFLADGLGVKQNTAKALDYLEQALNKGDKRAIVLIVDIYLNGRKDFNKDYKTAEIYILRGDYKNNAMLLYYYARLYENGWGVKKNTQKAEMYLRQAIKLNQKFSYPAKAELTELLYNHNRNIREAESLISDYLSVKNKSSLGIYLLGRILYKEKKYDDALEQLKQASESEPENGDITNCLGDVYFALGKTKEAKEQWQKALDLTQDKEQRKKIEKKLKGIS